MSHVWQINRRLICLPPVIRVPHDTAESSPGTAAAALPASVTPHRRILELDGLRACAAISLVLFHFTHVYSVKYGYSSPLGFVWNYGAYGTEMFFILSGYVNSMSLLRRHRPGDFLAARVIRIVPMFLMVVLANAWICTRVPLAESSYTWPQLLANLTLVPKVFGYECLDPVMWTLQIEMLFYGLLVGVYCLTRRMERAVYGWAPVLAAAAILCPYLDAQNAAAAGESWFQVASGIRQWLVLDFAPLFVIGSMIYMLQVGENARRRRLHQTLLIVAAFVFHSIDHGKHNPLATTLLIGLVTAAGYGRLPMLRVTPLIFISTISYAVYLCHNNLGVVLIHAFDSAGVPPQLCFGIAIVFTLSLSLLVTRWVEQPMTRWLRERYAIWCQRTTPVGLIKPTVQSPAAGS